LSFVVEGQIKNIRRVETLDARQWDFSKRFPLKGNWSFIENNIDSPHTISENDLTVRFFPSLWNDYRSDRKGTGYATYVLNVLLPDSITAYAFEIPQLYSCYKLWVNGNLITSTGIPGVKQETTVPKWFYQKAPFSSTRDTLQIVLQLANFHHHKGGSMNPIYLGTKDVINKHFNWSIGSNVFEAVILLLEGMIFLYIYKRKGKKVILYFALLCLTWSVRSIFSNLYPLILVFPDFSWQWMVKIEYISLYLMVIWAALFFNAIFKDISNVIFTYLPIIINLFFVVFTLFTPAIIFTRWVSIYLGVAALVILYGVILIVRALLIDRGGSWFLMASIWVGVLLFGYDIAAYQVSFSYNVVFLNIGYVVIFMLTTVALLYHLGILKSNAIENNVLTLNDVYNPNKNRNHD
jgi:hypothetical protein